jgi:tryptophan synthase beta chain
VSREGGRINELKAMTTRPNPLTPAKGDIHMSDSYKFLLDESKLPEAWYNINADMPVSPGPLLHPATKEPVTPDFLAVLFPMKFIMEAVSAERWIEIPEPVREIYKMWRPTPLIRARRLEKALDTPAHIYYKYEGVSPVGSHKPNTAVPQAFYAKEEGAAGFTTETGAGQWGSALAMACSFFGLECHVYMVRVSYNQKPYRRVIMETFGATVVPSPSDKTEYGRKLLAENPDHPGSLGIAISEGVEAAVTSNGKYKYSLGSVLPPVLMHQTVVGLEALQQMEMAGEYPDMVIGCIGGGSNFSGFVFPFLHQNFTAGKKTRVIAVEPMAAPSLTKGLRCTRLATPSCRQAFTPAGCAITAWRRTSARCTTTATSRRWRCIRWRRSMRLPNSRARKASSPHPNRRTRCAWRSTRR